MTVSPPYSQVQTPLTGRAGYRFTPASHLSSLGVRYLQGVLEPSPSQILREDCILQYMEGRLSGKTGSKEQLLLGA